MHHRGSRRLLVFILCAVLFVQTVPALGAQAYPFVGFAMDSLQLRREASGSGYLIRTIAKDEALVVSNQQGAYFEVSYQGDQGYVLAAYVSLQKGGPAAAAPAPIPVVPTDIQLKYPQLANSMESPQVKALQEALIELGFLKGRADGKFGPATLGAVSAFQKMNGLTQTGIADPLSQQRLFEGRPKNAAGRATQVMTLPAVDGLTLRPGNRGDQIALLQQRLKELGYYKGSVDAVYGRGTEDAVRAFQSFSKIKADGIAGPDTLGLLYLNPDVVTVAPAATETPYVGPTPAPTFGPEEAEATYPYQTTASAAVNMRKSASLSGARMLTVPNGAQITVLETRGDFLKVSYRNYTGYVMAAYVNVPEQYLEGKTLPFSTTARQNYETLAVGASGPKVKALQQALQELGFYQGGVDGSFGAGTLSAVKAMQEKNKLRPTGIALPELQELIYEGRPRNERGRLVRVAILPPVPGWPMQEGDKGEAVLGLHRSLKLLNVYSGPMSEEFSRATTNAVKVFQKDHSIRQTGKVDEFTLLAINTLIDKVLLTPMPSAEPTVMPTVPAVVTAVPGLPMPVVPTILRIGTAGEAVLALQSRLISLLYLKGEADGVYGTQTAKAVTAFQRASGLSADGIAGPDTVTALYAAGATGNDYVSSGNSPDPDSDSQLKILRVGDSGSEVRAMQQKLIDLKYMTGGADGIFGPKSFVALQSFQSNNRLTADGIAGKLTLAKLADPRAISASGLSVTLPTPTLPPVAPTQAPSQAGFQAPRPAEVINGDWYGTVRGKIRSLPNVIVYDFMSGAHYNVKVFSVGKHADGEPVTRQDTQTMESALGFNNWTPRPVWIVFSDGSVYMASTHSHGHEVDHNANNGLTGHICIHFPRTMEDAAATGPYAVQHQQAILAGWDLTQSMIR